MAISIGGADAGRIAAAPRGGCAIGSLSRSRVDCGQQSSDFLITATTIWLLQALILAIGGLSIAAGLAGPRPRSAGSLAPDALRDASPSAGSGANETADSAVAAGRVRVRAAIAPAARSARRALAPHRPHRSDRGTRPGVQHGRALDLHRVHPRPSCAAVHPHARAVEDRLAALD